jgi:hypothetical protein
MCERTWLSIHAHIRLECVDERSERPVQGDKGRQHLVLGRSLPSPSRIPRLPRTAPLQVQRTTLANTSSSSAFDLLAPSARPPPHQLFTSRRPARRHGL